MGLSRSNRNDLYVAVGVGICSLAVYVRTLAPGLLYSDSAEFQTLVYTLGISHPSGYAVYLLLAKLATFLPIQSIPWRVNFVSAFCGATTLALVCWLVCQLTRSRVAAVLASMMLGIGYTFWSQTIIAEVYTMAFMFVALILTLLWNWQTAPAKRGLALCLACLLVGVGMHIMVVLIAPAILILVFWTLSVSRLPASAWWRSILWATGGFLMGVLLFCLAFWVLDAHNPPTSYTQVTLIPSRSAWGVALTDLDDPMERFAANALDLQWRKSFFAGNLPYLLDELKHYVKWTLKYDLTLGVILLGFPGILVIFRRSLNWGAFLLIYGALLLFFILDYEGPGKFVFYPFTYLLIVMVSGSGAGELLDRFHRWLSTSVKKPLPFIYTTVVLLIILVVVKPYWVSRWQAIRLSGAAFVEDDNTYPFYNLQEPQQQAEQRLSQVEDNAVLILDWKTLYSTYYVSYIEQSRKEIRIMEDCISSDDGLLADSLVEEITKELRTGKPVYSDRSYTYLEQTFDFTPVPGTDLVRMILK